MQIAHLANLRGFLQWPLVLEARDAAPDVGTDSLTLGYSCSRPPRLPHAIDQVFVVHWAIVRWPAVRKELEY